MSEILKLHHIVSPGHEQASDDSLLLLTGHLLISCEERSRARKRAKELLMLVS